jgi:hypothetical protein
MSVGEAELRKRLWWWVYILDRYELLVIWKRHFGANLARVTTIVHGFRPVITDADVDNELPTDCHIDDFAASELLPFQARRPLFHFSTNMQFSARKCPPLWIFSLPKRVAKVLRRLSASIGILEYGARLST